MEARDVMTALVITAHPSTPVEQLAKLMLERRISAVPIVDASGRLQGIVSEGDLMRHSKAGTERTRSWWLSFFADRDAMAQEYIKSHGRTAADVMTRKVVTATESAPLEKIATLLERHRIKRVPIVHRGRVVGIVSRANLLHGLVARKVPVGKSVVKDRDIRARILHDLNEAGVNKGYINVVVSNGVVDLWGLVETESQKRALAIAARTAKGVKRVIDNVMVITPALRSAMAR
jgi:CBS domain-containing protein